MSLTQEYRRQLEWRSWNDALAALPDLDGQRVLDLGCAVGDQAALFAARGAHVIGFDENPELLAAARRRQILRTEFHQGDIRAPQVAEPVDGIWSSFTAAYLLDLPRVLLGWKEVLRPGGWIALTEVDDLFGHEPLDKKARKLLEDYVEDALDNRRYDFHAGSKLKGYLKGAGFKIDRELELPDEEFSFQGPARRGVLQAWNQRLERMKVLQDFCGPDFSHVREALLTCLSHPEHRSRARVCCVVAAS